MAISLYDCSVKSFLQVLGAVGGFLEKGRAHLVEAGKDPDEIVGARLHDDMLPFAFQIASVAHHSKGALEGCKAGVFNPPGPFGQPTYADLQAWVADAKSKLESLSADEVNALEGRDMVFQLGAIQMPFTAEGFLLSFSTPNLHFHATTAYDILRQAGVPLGKRDYMGGMRLKK